MINEKNLVINGYNIKTLEERINYLTIRIQILKEHLTKYGHLTEPIAYEFIANHINACERELQIRKDFPINF